MIESSKSQRCLPLFPFDKDIDEYYIMVDSCAPGANETDIERCFNSSSNDRVDQMPALGDDKFLYKNKFCARCNNIYNYSINDIVDVTCSFHKDYFTAIELLKSPFYKQYCSTKASDKIDRNSVLKCKKKRCSQLDATLCRLIAAKIGSVKNLFCYNCLSDLMHVLLKSIISISSCADDSCRSCFTEGDWSRVIDLNDLKKEITCGINQLKNVMVAFRIASE